MKNNKTAGKNTSVQSKCDDTHVGSMDELVKDAEYKQHPYGKVWQPFDGETFVDLVGNIRARGLDKEISMYQGMVLEGWHRYLACLAAKVTPRLIEFTGTDLEAAELVHASGIRRQSNPDQRYASFVLLCDACPAFAKKYEGLKAKGEEQQKEGKPLATGDHRVDVVAAKAKAAGVGKTTAKKVERVKKENPSAVAEIAAGNTSANKEIKKLDSALSGKRQKAKAPAKNERPVKGDRPTISEVIQIIYRGLSKADEVEGLAPRANAIYFQANGYRIKVTCKIM